jgi:predicted nucleotidyltransferase
MRMYLDKILGSKTKINLLSVLVSHPDRRIVENELAKEAEISVSEANRQIGDLVNVGLITMERVGRSKLYWVNREHFLFEPLKAIFRSLNEVYREIAEKVATFVTSEHEARAVVLFGSVALEQVHSDLVKEPSDVDIMVIVEKKSQVEPTRKSVFAYVGTKIFPAYGINAYPIVVSVDEYLSGLSKDTFIMNVHSSGEVLYGEKPRRFG